MGKTYRQKCTKRGDKASDIAELEAAFADMGRSLDDPIHTPTTMEMHTIEERAAINFERLNASKKTHYWG